MLFLYSFTRPKLENQSFEYEGFPFCSGCKLARISTFFLGFSCNKKSILALCFLGQVPVVRSRKRKICSKYKATDLSNDMSIKMTGQARKHEVAIALCTLYCPMAFSLSTGAVQMPSLEMTGLLFHMSRVVRKPAFCICENKDADQLRGNREADQCLCFRYTDSTISLLLYLNTKFQASSHLLWLHSPVCLGPGRKPERWLSRDAAHISVKHVDPDASFYTI